MSLISTMAIQKILYEHRDHKVEVVDWSFGSRAALRVLRASTWPYPLEGGDPFPDIGPGESTVSPDGNWEYVKQVLPPFMPLRTINHLGEFGVVMFDGAVPIPALFHIDDQTCPFMSLTPAEIDTLQPGTDLARGHVVIGGLGLGYQLIEVAKLDRVEKITLVEKSRELVDWIWPRVGPLLLGKPCEVIVGDAYEEVPKLTADIALLDMFPTYGGNEEEMEKISAVSPGIGSFWAWGAGDILPPANYKDTLA